MFMVRRYLPRRSGTYLTGRHRQVGELVPRFDVKSAIKCKECHYTAVNGEGNRQESNLIKGLPSLLWELLLSLAISAWNQHCHRTRPTQCLHSTLSQVYP